MKQIRTAPEIEDARPVRRVEEQITRENWHLFYEKCPTGCAASKRAVSSGGGWPDEATRCPVCFDAGNVRRPVPLTETTA